MHLVFAYIEKLEILNDKSISLIKAVNRRKYCIINAHVHLKKGDYTVEWIEQSVKHAVKNTKKLEENQKYTSI